MQESRREGSRWVGTSVVSTIVLASLVWACAELPSAGEPAGPDDVVHAETAASAGRELYEAHCSVCHGVTGAGDGPAYGWLFPRARDFTSGVFRLVSTDNGVPSRADLVHTLRRGVPGSAMPSWSWMEEPELHVLADHVRELAVEGLTERLRRRAYLDGSSDDLRTARARATEALEPGASLPPLADVVVDSSTLEHGRKLYSAQCALCHGVTGEGDATPRLDDDGSLNWPRDLTGGYLKGGASPDQLAYRIRAGIPGTAMPSSNLSDEDLGALVAYLGELIPDGTEDRFVQRRETIAAVRTDDLPTTADDGRWDRAGSVRVVLTPLIWRMSSIHEADVSAMHDGTRIALRVRWQDATGGESGCLDTTSFDALAVQLSDEAAPRLFGMGSAHHPTDIWHWKAARFDDVAGRLDLLGQRPHGYGEPQATAPRPDAHSYRESFALPEASTEVDAARAEGVGELAGVESDAGLQVTPTWREGVWEVVFVRDLVSGPDGGIELWPGERLQLAVAVWNCDAGDRAGQKSISIWHELALEP